MGSVGTPVVRRIVQVAQCPDAPGDLLASVGLSGDHDGAAWSGESVDEEAYYGLIERVTAAGDLGLPFRYAAALRADDLGALGLAVKTAPTAGDALGRLARYVLVLSDTLEYRMVALPGGGRFELAGRPHHRRGAAVANECALAAVTSVLRQAVGADMRPQLVTFRHDPPPDDTEHRRYFGCPVEFRAATNGIELDDEQLATATLLADEGLSAYLLAQLDDLTSRASERSLVASVVAAVADSLPDGQPSKSAIARRLGMSERTLHRRLADHDESFQALVTRTRLEVAESLLAGGGVTLAEVAFLTGFSDQTSFTRAFRRWTGTTPAAFRDGAAAD